MKPYFRVTWNVLKYNLIKFFKCKNLKIRGIVLLGYNTKLQVHKTSQICIGKNVVSDGRCVIIADKNAKVEIGDKVYFNENVMISAKKNITMKTMQHIISSIPNLVNPNFCCSLCNTITTAQFVIVKI